MNQGTLPGVIEVTPLVRRASQSVVPKLSDAKGLIDWKARLLQAASPLFPPNIEVTPSPPHHLYEDDHRAEDRLGQQHKAGDMVPMNITDRAYVCILRQPSVWVHGRCGRCFVVVRLARSRIHTLPMSSLVNRLLHIPHLHPILTASNTRGSDLN